MRAISDNLIHFLGRKDKSHPSKQFEAFKSIIETGLRCNRVESRYGDGQRAFSPAVCFTDMPLSYCGEHTATYGRFGIGFKKSYVKRSGGNPAIYYVDHMPSQTQDDARPRGTLNFVLSRILTHALKIDNLIKKDQLIELVGDTPEETISKMDFTLFYEDIKDMFSFGKEIGDLGDAGDVFDHGDLFYKEREWRLVPSFHVRQAKFCEERDQINYFTFDRDDLNIVVTPNEEMKSAVVKYFSDLSGSDDNRLKEFARHPVTVVNFDDLQNW